MSLKDTLANKNRNTSQSKTAEELNNKAEADLNNNKTAVQPILRDKNLQPEPSAVEEKFIYSCPQAHAWSIHLSEGPVQAKNGVLTVDKAQHKEIQKLIQSGRFDIAQNAILLDTKAAEEYARKYLEEHPPIPDAKKGATSSAGTMALMQNLEGKLLPNALASLDVVELDATHAEDGKFNPEGGNADNIPRDE